MKELSKRKQKRAKRKLAFKVINREKKLAKAQRKAANRGKRAEQETKIAKRVAAKIPVLSAIVGGPEALRQQVGKKGGVASLKKLLDKA